VIDFLLHKGHPLVKLPAQALLIVPENSDLLMRRLYNDLEFGGYFPFLFNPFLQIHDHVLHFPVLPLFGGL
jgi:hypothetical protein